MRLLTKKFVLFVTSKMIEELTSQRIDFNEWLKQCPVQWSQHPIMNGDDSFVYEFFLDEVGEDDD